MTATALALILFFSPTGQSVDGLDSLLREHFLARSTPQRRAIQDRILVLSGLTHKKLAGAIRHLQLWDNQQTGVYETAVRLRKSKSSEKRVWLRVPQSYDPARRWPLIITLHGQGSLAENMLRVTRQMLGDRADEFILAAPQDIGPLGFNLPSHVVAAPRNLLNALRRRFHIDSDRVYLMGYSLGSHNTWLGAVMHADCFAGIVPLATPLQVVGREMLYDELLPNTRNLAILFCWGKLDEIDSEGKVRPDGGNARLNRTMARVIMEQGFKHFQAVEHPNLGHHGVYPPAGALGSLLDRRRRHYPRRVRQTFRLPDQSDAYWVGADRLLGKPLSEGTIQVPVEPGEDRVAAQKKYLVNKLGMIDARCRKQTLKLTTRRCGRVILLLSDELLDLGRPVTIIRNKKTRYEGRIKRDLRVTLTEAARGWDFERLPTARVVIPVGGKVKFGYPERASKKAEKKRRKER